MIDKTINTKSIEDKARSLWKQEKKASRTDCKPYCIVLPPPNVTGSLHIGHSLCYTLQDILIRYHKLKGLDVLWQPGLDHAGIVTQLVVERELAQKGFSKHDLGRNNFIDEIWRWKEHSGGQIVNQMERLGTDCDWDRMRFTMDDHGQESVKKVFVSLYRDGLIYRDKRLVNWDPKLKSAISDLEVLDKEVNGNLWYIKYPYADGNGHITVATTRPETMLGDVAVAVHPDDERYKNVIGKHVQLPLTNRTIPIIADEYADKTKGSGAVKITPGHDFNDFEVGKRNNLPTISIMDSEARLNENVSVEYQGLDRFDARKKIVEDLEAIRLLEKIEPIVHAVPHGDRSGVPLEPFLTDQWFVDSEVLAKPALEAVEDGRIKFYPDNWKNTYFDWLKNIRPWCISRQIWWGHQIPAWYGPDEKVFVAESTEEAMQLASAHYGHDVMLRQDEDVLDTWFSSALWPFSTMGWPEKTPELDKFYPGSVLVTGFDIIFFWVARMVMMGMYFMKEIPFKDICIHPLVRDEKGNKMSKSKGNVVDPLVLIDEYGSDALRLTLSTLCTPGRDIKFGKSQIEGNRNFTTKLWNAVRFAQMNECKIVPDFDITKTKLPLSHWIAQEMQAMSVKIETALNEYRFDEASLALYHTVWGTFCDWYLELAKPLFQDEKTQWEVRATTAWCIDYIIRVAHPFIPFITEEIASSIDISYPLTINNSWPSYELPQSFVDSSNEISWIMELVKTVRSVRSDINIPASSIINMHIQTDGGTEKCWINRNSSTIEKLGRVSIKTEKPDGKTGSSVITNAVIHLELDGIIDFNKEKTRLLKEIESLEKEKTNLTNRLNNPQFCSKASEEVIDDHNKRLQQTNTRISQVNSIISQL